MMKRALLATGFAVLILGSQAKAADLPFPPPMPEPVLPPIESSGGGWYLRGDVGVGLENMRGFNFDVTNACCAGALNGFSLIQKSMNDKAIIGTGLGYQWNDYLRFDVTGEYRAANSFGFTLAGPTPAPNQQFNIFTGTHAAAVGLFNAYYDIGDFWGIMPFVGAGAGFAYHQITGFHDVGEGSSAGGFGIAESKTSSAFAWAIHAGMDYEVNQNLKLEMSYRYLDEGNANAGTVTCFNVVACADVNYTLRDITSHDMRIGMRWTFNAPPHPLPASDNTPVARKY
jgi:opacity protein-like surface antigen